MPFLILFVLDKQVHLCYLLKHEMKEKRSNQSKVPSINKQALFSFPSLSFFATSCIYSGAFFRSQSKRALGARSLLPDVPVRPCNGAIFWFTVLDATRRKRLNLKEILFIHLFKRFRLLSFSRINSTDNSMCFLT